jgi:DNA-binding response OmpR family regulator
LAHALELRLRANGYEVLLADDRSSAITLALAQNPIAVILDLRLENQDGLAVMQELRISPGLSLVPVIIVSADCSLATQHKVLDAGAYTFLEKPVNHRLLLDVLRDIQARSRTSPLLESGSQSKELR